jgi:hypothetical protein
MNRTVAYHETFSRRYLKRFCLNNLQQTVLFRFLRPLCEVSGGTAFVLRSAWAKCLENCNSDTSLFAVLAEFRVCKVWLLCNQKNIKYLHIINWLTPITKWLQHLRVSLVPIFSHNYSNMKRAEFDEGIMFRPIFLQCVYLVEHYYQSKRALGTLT